MNHAITYNARWKALAILFASILVLQLVVLLPKATAASLVNTSVRFDHMQTSTQTTGTVCAAASSAGAGTETSVKVTFPSGYTVSTTVADWSVDTSTTTGWPTGATAWPGIAQATTASDQNVTFPSNDLTDTTVHCFNWDNPAAVETNSAVASDSTGSVTTQAAGPTAIDTGNYATATISNDQISVDAQVDSTFSFALNSNTASLGTLSTSSPSSATAINASVTTNAQGGWQMWAADPAGSPGLTSTAAAHTINYSPTAGSAAAVLSSGAEGYNLGAGASSGTCNGSTTYDPAFNNSAGTTYKGGGLDNSLRTLVGGGGTANGCAIPLTVNASIAGTTPAANDYSGLVTVVAAGIF